MLSPAALLVSAVATIVLGAGPTTAHTVVAGPVPAVSPATQMVAAPSSSRCPKHGHHQRCHRTRDSGSDIARLTDAEVTVVGAALVALALAAL